MSNLHVIAEDPRAVERLCQGLRSLGHACQMVSASSRISGQTAIDLVLTEASSYGRAAEMARKVKREKNLPIIALVHEGGGEVGSLFESIDDFAVAPWREGEIDLRVKRLLRRAVASTETIKCGDLLIDVAAYQVYVSGRPVDLTFKEYELLKFLAGNPDRVFSRETLLNRVWGYDYYGGDRTVDVHVQRLRTKIERSTGVVIETVRNIGYRLKNCAG